MKFPLTRAEQTYSVAKIPNGKLQTIGVYAFPEAYCGTPAVCISADLEREALTPDQAEKLGEALIAAARTARGVPRKLDMVEALGLDA